MLTKHHSHEREQLEMLAIVQLVPEGHLKKLATWTWSCLRMSQSLFTRFFVSIFKSILADWSGNQPFLPPFISK
jgi:hypothetical protein